MNPIAMILALFVSIALLLAQLRLFSIDTTLKEILKALEKQNRQG